VFFFFPERCFSGPLWEIPGKKDASKDKHQGRACLPGTIITKHTKPHSYSNTDDDNKQPPPKMMHTKPGKRHGGGRSSTNHCSSVFVGVMATMMVCALITYQLSAWPVTVRCINAGGGNAEHEEPQQQQAGQQHHDQQQHHQGQQPAQTGQNPLRGRLHALAQTSFSAHALHIGREDRHIFDSDEAMKSYLDPGALDQRRHGYMLSATEPLLGNLPGSYWLTVGDLRFGSDAIYLRNRGARIMASDLDDSRLKLAQSRGYFAHDEISAQNVESLSYEDDAFDYVLCKEAFHHFPRPMMGFYEMLRVAKRGVVIIEPHDVQDPVSKNTVLTSYHSDGYNDRFEVVGNYKYQLSVRELTKAAWALKLSAVAVRGFNDHFVPDMTWEVFKARVDDLNGMGYSGERQFNLVAVVVFKEAPSDKLASDLVARNFTLMRCPDDCRAPDAPPPPAALLPSTSSSSSEEEEYKDKEHHDNTNNNKSRKKRRELLFV
jgi:SAM-dependent methyltransferase